MCQAGAMAETYEANRSICKYVHSTSRGHEAIQLATAFHLLPCDYVSPYYRDESLLLGLGFTPYELMLQLLAKKNDISREAENTIRIPATEVKTNPPSSIKAVLRVCRQFQQQGLLKAFNISNEYNRRCLLKDLMANCQL
jgi:hypothetical protein